MLLFSYLDRLPSIPRHLLDQQQKHRQNHHALPVRKSDDGRTVENIDYRRWDLDTELNDWIKENIGEVDATGLQISESINQSTTHLCHSDSYPRRWVLNYMFDPGGENVTTRFFKERNHPMTREPLTRPVPEFNPDLEVIYSTVIEPCRWAILNSSVLHDVIGITGTRRAITLAIADANPFGRIKNYQGLLSL